MSLIDKSDLEHIWQHAEQVQYELNHARIFLTGGTGFFGCWLLESILYAKKYLRFNTEVVVLTRDPKQFRKKAPHLVNRDGIRLLEGDVRTFNFPKEKFTHLIHAATDASAKLNEENPMLMLNTITEGTNRVLEFAVISEIKKFLFTSSGAIYGRQPPELSHLTEDYLGSPNPLHSGSAYGIGKYYAEHLCLLAAKKYNFEIKIARCFAFIGPYLPLKKHFAIGNFIYQALKNKPIKIHGDGSPFRSYLYAADLIIWLWIILCKGQSCEAFNVGSEIEIDIESLARKVAAHIQPNLTVQIAKTRNFDALPERYVPSIKKAKQHLGLHEWIDLTTAIQKTLYWSKQRAAACE